MCLLLFCIYYYLCIKSIVIILSCILSFQAQACTAYDLIWYTGTQSLGGVEQSSITSMYDCAQACAVDPCCAGIDWNGSTNKCYFHFDYSNFNNVISNPDITQLRKPVPCP